MISRRAVLASVAGCGLQAQAPKKMFGDAEAYERFMGRWSSLLAPLLVNFANSRNSGRVLDVGSGTGALAFAIGKMRPQCHVLGIDPSDEYIRFAESRNPFPRRAKFEVGDAQKLRFPPASFDHSLSLLVFNFIPDRKKALAEVARVTKPGGCVAAAVWDYGEGMRMLRAFWDAAATIDPAAKKLDEASMPLCRSGELAQLWKEGGFEQVTDRPLDITMPFQSFADYWDPFLLGQGPAGAFVRDLNEDRRRALREELKRRLSIHAESAQFSLIARAWAVRGVIPVGR